MELRYRAQKVFLTTADQTSLHCYWVPCLAAQYQEANAENDASQIDEMGHSIKRNDFPTMIFCNPNAGFAEFFQYQSDWLDYYV